MIHSSPSNSTSWSVSLLYGSVPPQDSIAFGIVAVAIGVEDGRIERQAVGVLPPDLAAVRTASRSVLALVGLEPKVSSWGSERLSLSVSCEGTRAELALPVVGEAVAVEVAGEDGGAGIWAGRAGGSPGAARAVPIPTAPNSRSAATTAAADGPIDIFPPLSRWPSEAACGPWTADSLAALRSRRSRVTPRRVQRPVSPETRTSPQHPGHGQVAGLAGAKHAQTPAASPLRSKALCDRTHRRERGSMPSRAHRRLEIGGRAAIAAFPESKLGRRIHPWPRAVPSGQGDNRPRCSNGQRRRPHPA